MQEIRILFSPSEGRSRRVSLTDGERQPIGVELSFEPFLSDDDYDNLRWYLEEFMELPDGGAVIRAQRIEADLLQWGRRLHDAIFSAGQNQAELQKLLAAPEPRELTIATSEPELLRLPWELMADAAGSLALRVSVRRQLDVAQALVAREVKLPLCILYIVSRPEDTGFIDPRLTSQALFTALDPLGASMRLDFCRPPTLARMDVMLREGQRAGDPYDVVHFDGHGTFLPHEQIGALCFEKTDDGTGDAQTDLIAADQLGNLLAQHQIPLVVLPQRDRGQDPGRWRRRPAPHSGGRGQRAVHGPCRACRGGQGSDGPLLSGVGLRHHPRPRRRPGAQCPHYPSPACRRGAPRIRAIATPSLARWQRYK